MWKPTVVLEKIGRLFRLFTYSMLLFIHGSYFGLASLTLGKEPRKYNIPVVMASENISKKPGHVFIFCFQNPGSH